MDATEIRLGNIVVDEKGNICSIVFINKEAGLFRENAFRSSSGAHEGEIKPITITKDWCKKFEHATPDGFMFFLGSIQVTFWHDDSKFTVELSCGGRECFGLPTEIKYVHQLQNLYYALELKELILKKQ